MEKLHQQVFRARRRLIAQQFAQIVGWWSFAALVVAAAAIAVPKIWIMGFDSTQSTVWVTSWLCGSLAVAFVAAMWCAWWARRGVLEAAIEIDHRFGLRERVSSSLTLSPRDRETEAGQALIGDASHRVQRLEVGTQFRVRPSWRLLLPLLPELAVILLVFCVKDAAQAKSDLDGAKPIELKKQIENSLEGIKPKITERKKKADELGLKDASELFDRLEQGVDEMTKKGMERKDAAIKLNELSKELKRRRQDLGGTDEIKKQLDQLGNLNKGPADKVADALKEGDFEKAMDELKELKEKLEQDELTDEEKKQMADQMDQVRDKIQDMVDAHQAARQELENQIQQQQGQGNMDEVAKLQNQLDQLNAQCPQMDKMQQFADQLGECAQCLQDGNLQDAMGQIDQMAGALEDLQRELDELEMLDDMLQQIADAKDAMNCQQCQGQGCKACQGQGMGGQGQGEGEGGGDGLGEGQGVGARPEKDTGNEQFYDSPVPAEPGPGAAVMVGRVSGPNKAGQAREIIKTEIEAARHESAHAVSAPKMPRPQREHAQQYFDVFREGER